MTSLQLLAAFVRRWRLMVLTPMFAAVAVFLVALVLPRSYAGVVTFVPGASSRAAIPAMFAGLAGQFGLSLASAEANESPDFYRSLAQTRPVIDSVLLAAYPSPSASTDSANLLAILDVRGTSAAQRRERGRRKFRKHFSIHIERETGIVQLRVEMPTPELAAAVANRFFDELSEFNVATRQTTARARRAFLESRLSEAEADLRAAEAALRTFLQHNVRWRDAPELTFEHGRIERDVQRRQEVYLTLVREYETARIDEVDDTPVLTLVAAAEPPVRQDWPRPLLLAAAAAFAGGVGAVLMISFRMYRGRVRDDDPEGYADATAAFREVREQLRGPWRR